jgi:methylamine dehydrogenase accessory protein MauD
MSRFQHLNTEGAIMGLFWLASWIALWVTVLFLGFLLLGSLRALALLRWRLEQVEATMPSKVNRNGLKLGTRAPEFSLPDTAGDQVSLRDFAGRRVFLVFTQSGCRPCHAVLPELEKLQAKGEVRIIVVNNGDLESTRDWTKRRSLSFPVLVQERYELSKRYEAFATPFAFLIDERGLIASKGIINNRQHIEFVLSGATGKGASHHRPSESGAAVVVGS